MKQFSACLPTEYSKCRLFFLFTFFSSNFSKKDSKYSTRFNYFYSVSSFKPYISECTALGTCYSYTIRARRVSVTWSGLVFSPLGELQLWGPAWAPWSRSRTLSVCLSRLCSPPECLPTMAKYLTCLFCSLPKDGCPTDPAHVCWTGSRYYFHLIRTNKRRSSFDIDQSLGSVKKKTNEL